jgi:hypothetical protein
MTTYDLFHQTLNPTAKPSPVILNQFGRTDLIRLLNQAALTKGVEVGVADGRHALLLCHGIAGLELIGVDPWIRYKGNSRGGGQEQQSGNLEKAKARLAGFGVKLRQAKSMDAVKDVEMESLDFCYIDGNHTFDYVMMDILEWAKRVRQDGVIAGHDFYEFGHEAHNWAGVQEAVVAYTTAHHVTEWFVTEEREPTWFFVKEAEKFPHRGW